MVWKAVVLRIVETYNTQLAKFNVQNQYEGTKINFTYFERNWPPITLFFSSYTATFSENHDLHHRKGDTILFLKDKAGNKIKRI